MEHEYSVFNTKKYRDMLRIIQRAIRTFIESIFPKKSNSEKVRDNKELIITSADKVIVYRNHRALLSYRKTNVHHLVHALKYEKDKLSNEIAVMIFNQYLTRHLPTERKILLCTIPTTLVRKRENRYDHMYKIVDALSKNSTLQIQNGQEILQWCRQTKRQSTLSKENRIKNMYGAMQATNNLDKKVMYVVIDDVLTTGATLSEAQRALKEGGADTVLTLALAH